MLRPAVPGYVLGAAAVNELGMGLLGTLHKREGEQRYLAPGDGTAAPREVWGRAYAGRLTQDGARQFNMRQTLGFVQFGGDVYTRYGDGSATPSRAHEHAGLTFSLGNSQADFEDRARTAAGRGSRTGELKSQMATLGGYYTRYADNGAYVDVVGQLHSVRNAYKDMYGTSATQRGTGYGLSVEVGRPWALGDSDWSVEPQAQLSYLSTRYRRFNDAISSVAALRDSDLRGRLGVRLAWRDRQASGSARSSDLKASDTFYFTANLLHSFKPDHAAAIGGIPVSESLARRTWAELGVGAQYQLQRATYLYGGLQYQRSLGGNGRHGVSGEVGLRARW